MPDKILTHRVLSIPIFLCIMLLIFYLTFNSLGAYLSDLLSLCIDRLVAFISYELLAAGVNPAFHALVIEGICAGIGSVLSFLPIIAVMFGCLSILENSGYMSRISLVADELLSKLGLPGQSIVPLLIGFGCSVPAIMATRSLPSQRDRCLTIALIPFMSCSAKLPIYAVFISVFFSEHRMLAMMSVYITGIIVAIICALILKRTIYRGTPTQLHQKLPPYKIPSAKIVLSCMYENVKGFIKKAFTVVFMASVIIWFLQNFNTNLHMTASGEDSILAFLGKQAAPFFAPLGFGDWRAAMAIIAGLSAKETVVSTLAVLASSAAGNSLQVMLTEVFSPLSAFSFLIFCLLYVPCAATLITIKKEMGSRRYVLLATAFQIIIAWLTSFIIFNAGSICSGI